MDGARFDDLTREFGAGASRRTVLAGLVGGAAALARATGALAFRCRGAGQRCRSHADCCPRDNHLLCSAEGRCAPCAAGTTFCPGSGQCVAACAGGRVLDPGTCLCACPPETVVCAGACCAGSCHRSGDQDGTDREACVTTA